MKTLLTAKNISLAFGNSEIVRDVSFSLKSGETTALIGESGSGKTLLAKALIQMLPPGGTLTQGSLLWQGRETTPDTRTALRGKDIAFIFQEPLSSLNPALKIGLQLTEALAEHTNMTAREQKIAAAEMLAKVKIPDTKTVMASYPHQLSGGMRQRVMIAAALLLEPALLIADEPTTALDMVVRDEILSLMTDLATDMGAAVLIISHDLGAVARLADTIMVMEKGLLVETGTKADILASPKHPYTQKLLEAIPQPDRHLNTALAPEAAPLISVRSLEVAFAKRGLLPWQKQSHTVLKGITFDIKAGETLAIIGESGSGKTTLARTIAGLQEKSAGDIHFNGPFESAAAYANSGKLQYIFQDPAGALNPRFRIGTSLEESLLPLKLTREERQRRIKRATAQVSLPTDVLGRFPHQLSGGQRQRVCIARAIAPRPDLIIADEPVSALDVTVQKQVLELFLKLKKELGFACLFISHDLGVVEHIADRVGVLLNGDLVEIGPVAQIFNAPHHSYTQTLLAATPYLEKSASGYALARRYTHAA